MVRHDSAVIIAETDGSGDSSIRLLLIAVSINKNRLCRRVAVPRQSLGCGGEYYLLLLTNMAPKPRASAAMEQGSGTGGAPGDSVVM